MILRARCILPLCEPPIENGALVLNDGRIKWLGRWRECAAPDHAVLDLGEVALLPGLINAHAHLDYTSMAGQIPPPRHFPDWIKTILSFKAHWSCSEFAESWIKGARMLLESGVTTVADIESAPELIPQVWAATPLRVISFLEMTGVKSQRPAREILSETLEIINALPKLPGKEAALSPHSLYSTLPDLARSSAVTAEERSLLLSSHLAESISEFEMFRDARGPFHDWLKGQRKMDDCGRSSPIQLASEYRMLSPRFLAIHANYLAPGDDELLARSGASVVHCPASHDYFGHDPFPFAQLQKAGVNLCLGTDSLASSRKIAGKNPELNLWNEMRAFARIHPGVSPKEILSMTTINAAKALLKAGQIGQFREGFAADAVALAYAGPVSAARLHEELLYSGIVRQVIIAGAIVRSP